jgi:AcrR family transcriptional regulator
MTVQPATRRATRRRALVDAAIEVFRARGVEQATVDDIVTAAGVAKGTFYLYFRSKGDVVNAVAERVVAGVADRVETAIDRTGGSAVELIRVLGASMLDVGDESYERELIELFHRPENRAVHDRMTERVLARLTPLFAQVISEGIARGDFRPQDPIRTAAFVLACYGALHEVVTAPEGMPAAIADLEAFVLRGLGIAAA